MQCTTEGLFGVLHEWVSKEVFHCEGAAPAVLPSF